MSEPAEPTRVIGVDPAAAEPDRSFVFVSTIRLDKKYFHRMFQEWLEQQPLTESVILDNARRWRTPGGS